MLSVPALARRWTLPPALFSLFRTAAIVLLLPGAAAFFLAPGARADIHTAKQKGKLPRDMVANPPATAIPDEEEIDPGGSVEITLIARGAGNKAVEFDFASQPKFGALTGFHQIGGNKAVVTYVHNPDSGPGQDEFTYRVQATGTGMSAPVKVEIKVREYQPQLAVVPAEVDFGVVNAGELARAQVTIRNVGGGTATGRLDLPSPWDVDGPSNFQLGAGEKQTFKLTFKPESGRNFSETVRIGDAGLGTQRNAALHLLGTGLGGPGAAPATAERQFAGINGVPPAPDEEPAAAVPPAAPAKSAPAATPKPVLAAVDPGLERSLSPATRPPAMDSAPGDGGAAGGPGFVPPVVILNEAGVKQVTERSHGRTQIQITWKEPQPRPAKYRVEFRRLSLDNDDNLVISWQPSDKVSYRTSDGVVTATAGGLPAGTNQTVRVVAIDSAGRFATPSQSLEIPLDPPIHWLRLSFVQWLFVALAICVAFVVRSRWQNQQILAQIDADRALRRRVEA